MLVNCVSAIILFQYYYYYYYYYNNNNNNLDNSWLQCPHLILAGQSNKNITSIYFNSRNYAPFVPDFVKTLNDFLGLLLSRMCMKLS